MMHYLRVSGRCQPKYIFGFFTETPTKPRHSIYRYGYLYNRPKEPKPQEPKKYFRSKSGFGASGSSSSLLQPFCSGLLKLKLKPNSGKDSPVFYQNADRSQDQQPFILPAAWCLLLLARAGRAKARGNPVCAQAKRGVAA
jgi:hypothetical protein